MISVKEMIAVMQAYDGGARVQARTRGASGTWIDIDVPSFDWFSHEYRAKPVSPDEINWSEVHEDYKFMARDDSGDAYVFKNMPIARVNSGYWISEEGLTEQVNGLFSSYRNNGKDWKDSLVERPSLANKFNEEE